MAINFTDFSKAPLQNSAAASIFENILKGYKMGKEPEKIQQESDSRALANKLKDLEVQHKPKEYALNDAGKSLANALHQKALDTYDERWELDKQVKQANIQKAKSGGIGKPSGDVGNAMIIQQYEDQLGADNPLVKRMKEAYEVNKRAKEVNTKSKEGYANSLAFRSMPVDEKKRAVALTTGMGIDPTIGERLLVEGKSLTDIAKEYGADLNSTVPVYPVGTENIKQTQRRGAFVKELSYLDKEMTGGLAKYQNKFMGYSLKQIANAIKNDDPDEQGRLLASRALAPEIAALRLKIAGGNIGIEAINELKNKSLGDMKILESTVTGEAFTAMQHYMNKWINHANSEFERAINEYGMLKTGSQRSAESESRVFDLSTGEFE